MSLQQNGEFGRSANKNLAKGMGLTYRVVQTSQQFEMCILSHEHTRFTLLCNLDEEGQCQGQIQRRLSEPLGAPECDLAWIQARASVVGS
jgi:hypothetical protein